MQAIICNRDHPEYGVATIPFPIPDKEYDHCIEMLEQLEIGDVTAHDCYVDQISGAPPALDFLEGTMVNVDELDFLARSIDRYTDEELAKFQCMASTREQWDMQTLINLSFCCEEVSVITDFSKLEEAGRSHYMTIHGGGVPTEEYNRLNGVGIARGLIAGGGKITPYGVVFENAMCLEPLYSGDSFPPYMDQDYLMEFAIETPREGDVTFFLPQPEKRLERLLERAHVDASTRLDIRTWHSDLPEEVMERIDFSHESIYEVNRLCAVIRGMDEAQRQKLSAAVLMTEPEYALQVRHLAENLDLFEFVPGVASPEAYAKHMIRESGHYEYDENLEPFYDYRRYGEHRVAEEGGQFTDLGYICYRGTMSLDELMMEDPAEAYQREQEQSQGLQMGGLSC